jgi:uncharacterized protein YqhQ
MKAVRTVLSALAVSCRKDMNRLIDTAPPTVIPALVAEVICAVHRDQVKDLFTYYLIHLFILLYYYYYYYYELMGR